MKTPEKIKNTEKMRSEQEGSMKNVSQLDKEMQEAIKIAQDLERQEEEEFMKRAIEESAMLDEKEKQKNKDYEDEEMKMIQQAIEMSNHEELQRRESVKQTEQIQH